MRFLADESCDFAIVRALRNAGHQVDAVTEIAPRAPDEAILRLAIQRKSMLLTEDKDFGQWLFAERRSTGGVMFLRYSSDARRAVVSLVVDVVERYESRLAGSFVVVQPGRVRIRRAT